MKRMCGKFNDELDKQSRTFGIPCAVQTANNGPCTILLSISHVKARALRKSGLANQIPHCHSHVLGIISPARPRPGQHLFLKKIGPQTVDDPIRNVAVDAMTAACSKKCCGGIMYESPGSRCIHVLPRKEPQFGRFELLDAAG